MKKLFYLSFLTLSLLTFSSKATEDFSSYTSIIVLRDQRVAPEEKERWIMKDILSLDNDKKKESRFLRKKIFKKGSKKRKRQTKLKEWIDSL